MDICSHACECEHCTVFSSRISWYIHDIRTVYLLHDKRKYVGLDYHDVGNILRSEDMR